MDLFTSLPGLTGVPVSGTTKSTVRTREGLQADLRVVASDEFGAALQYFSGSKEHNVRVREIAVKQGFKLSEYGLFRVSDNVKVAGATEDDVYGAMGDVDPAGPHAGEPGEVELALRGELPELIQLADIQGDLHSHTRYSDGSTTVREMALTAMGLGRRYLAITDHLDAWVKSHSPDTILLQAGEIAAVNKEFGDRITVLQGVEVDIGPEGTMALPDSILDAVDLVIASIHRRYGLGPEAMTRRVVKAMQHPSVNIFGHPTGRWIGSREAAEFDLEQVFAAARDNQVVMEINSNPARLDLKDDHIRLAKEFGLKFAVNTDSHNPGHLSRMRLGVGMAAAGVGNQARGDQHACRWPSFGKSSRSTDWSGCRPSSSIGPLWRWPGRWSGTPFTGRAPTGWSPGDWWRSRPTAARTTPTATPSASPRAAGSCTAPRESSTCT